MKEDVRDTPAAPPANPPDPPADPPGPPADPARGRGERAPTIADLNLPGEPHWLALPLGASPVARGRGGREHPARGISRARRGRRGDILDAALRLFNSTGYARTGVQDIAWEAGASVGSIYHHFAGKEEIAAALYVEGLRDYHRGLTRELELTEQGSAQVAVERLVGNHLRWVERNRELARFLLTSRDPEVVGASDVELAGMNARIFEAVGRWIERWVAAGAIREMPLGLFHAVVLGPSQEFARHWVAGRVKESIDEAERVLADAAWKAVKA